MTHPIRSSRRIKDALRAISGHLMYFRNVYKKRIIWFLELPNCYYYDSLLCIPLSKQQHTFPFSFTAPFGEIPAPAAAAIRFIPST